MPERRDELEVQTQHDCEDENSAVSYPSVYLQGRHRAKYIVGVATILNYYPDDYNPNEGHCYLNVTSESIMLSSGHNVSMLKGIQGRMLTDGPIYSDNDVCEYFRGFKDELASNRDVEGFEILDAGGTTESMSDEERRFFRKNILKIHFWLSSQSYRSISRDEFYHRRISNARIR